MTDQATDDESTDPAAPCPLIINTAIVGARFYDGATRLLEASANADPGLAPTVTLVREPGNKYDKNAIAVHLDCMKCGHIPAPQAKFLAPLLDAGAKILGVKRRGVTGLILTLEKAEEPARDDEAAEPSLKPDELGD